MKWSPILLCSALLLAGIVHGQNIGINSSGAAPDASAMLDITSNSSGLLIPRMTEAQKNAIVTPAAGLLIYQTNNADGFYYYDGTIWLLLGGMAWNLTGNAGTNAATNFIGTTDNNALRVGTNNSFRFEFTTNGRLRSEDNGSAAEPTYSWFGLGGTTTGMYRPASNTLALSTTSTERMRILSNGNVGISTAAPSQRLHVNGNLRLDGAFMPGNIAGTTGQVLLSNGAGNNPTWGPGMQNTAAINGIGKYYTGLFNVPNNQYLTLNINDPNMTTASQVSFTLLGNLPAGPLYGYDFTIIAEARAGQLRFHIINVSGYNLSNLEMSYVAFY